MILRYLNDSDYNTLLGWWESHGWKAPNRDFLPENGKGGLILLTQDNIPVCAGFIYFTNSKVCWLEYLISNPGYREDNRKHLINVLIEGLIDEANKFGFKYVFTVAKTKLIKSVFERNGFNIGTENTTEMVYVCNQH